MRKTIKSKREYVPREMIIIVERELQKMKKESKTMREPTRTEAYRRIADKLTRQLYKTKIGF